MKMIKQKKFLDKRTGEVVTSFNVLDIDYMEELDDDVCGVYMEMYNGGE